MSYSPTPRANEDDLAQSGDAGIMVLGVRQDVDASPVDGDGDYHTLQFNSVGRLKVATMPGNYSATTGSIVNASSVVSVDVSRASNVMATVTGTFTGVNFIFEGSLDGGTTWFTTQGVRSDSNIIETTSGVIATLTRAWEFSVNAMSMFRIRSTAWVSGTAAIRILPGSYATEPIPAAQVSATQPVSGSVTATMTSTTLTSVVPGVAATSLGKAEDAAAASGDTGVAVLAVRRDAATVSASATGDYNEVRVDQYGQTGTFPGVSGTDTLTSVTAAAASTQLLAANASRKGACFFNESTAVLYLALAGSASTTAYTVQIAAGGYYELPEPIRQGAIFGIWAAANGAVRITEMI